MSKYYMDNGHREVKTYEDGRTKQSFKDETDINKLLARAQKTGTISHLAKHEGSYGDFSDYDFDENMRKLARGREIFDELPSEVRREFNQSPQEFYEFVNDPKRAEKLATVLPQIADPGSYFPDVSSQTPPGATLDPNAETTPTIESPPPPETE